MKFLFHRLLHFFKSIKNKIAFFPTVLALLGLTFAFLMMFFEDRGISNHLVENFPILVVNSGDTALTILSVCITGLISMMVFSFSMVMVLLNQASSNYSPRLLPGLISNHNHQVVLGIYLFSILFCIFILFSIQPTGDSYQIPGFSVLLGIFFTVICICAFIYFIHNISNNIQINHILDNVFLSAKKNLELLLHDENDVTKQFPETGEWHEYYANKSGYYQNISVEDLLNICEDEGLMIHILPKKGSYILQGVPMFRTNNKLDEETVKKVFSNFHYSREELVSDNYVLGFKQITEIIVKAMSPGVNDPGTALNGIDYLTELFALRMLKKDQNIMSRNQKTYLQLRTVDFDELVYNVLASIRTYCKHDIIVVQKLALMMIYLKSHQSKNEKYLNILNKEAKTLLDDAKSSMNNKSDREVLSKLSRKLNVEFEH